MQEKEEYSNSFENNSSDEELGQISRLGFRVRYTIDAKPKNYRYHIIEERWIDNKEEDFDSKKEFYVSPSTMKQITGFIPSYGQMPVRIMWIIMPRVMMQDYESPLCWWLSENNKVQFPPFSYEVLRYFPEPGESLTHQAHRIHGRFRGGQC